jgi:uncharacterized phage protein (TIGR02218 family)
MKTLPTGLTELLTLNATTMVHCWKVTREDDTVFGFTEHDKTLTFDSVDFEAGAALNPTEIATSIGLSVDNFDVQGVFQSEYITETDLSNGLYDNALVEVYWVNYEDVSERVLLGRGFMGNVRWGELAFTAEYRSLAQRLQEQSGRTYTKTCDAELGDSRCGVDLDALAVTGTVGAILTTKSFTLTSASMNTSQDYYSNGIIIFDTDYPYEVKSHNGNDIELWEVPALNITTSTTFTLKPGCDNTFETCKAKFDNVVNFRGFPFIPTQDYLQRVAKTTGTNDGSSLFNN